MINATSRENSAIIKEVIIGDCRLILGDCLDVMTELEEVDHVISDPPYEAETHRADRYVTHANGAGAGPLKFAPIGNRRDDVSRLSTKLSQGWIILFCQAEGVRLWQDSLTAAGAKPRNPMVWIKPDGMPQFNGIGPGMGYESMVTAWAANGRSKWNGGGRHGVFTFPRGEGRKVVHQTQKPVKLMCELVRLFSNTYQRVLDPFMGSGTTGVACVKLGRKFTGIELDPDYFEIACKRIIEAYEQPDMFIEAPANALPVQEDLEL